MSDNQKIVLLSFPLYVSNLVHLLKYDFVYLNRFVETKRYMDFVSPGSQAQASFFGVEAALEGLEPG